MKALFLTIAAPVALWFAAELRKEILRRIESYRIERRRKQLKDE